MRGVAHSAGGSARGHGGGKRRVTSLAGGEKCANDLSLELSSLRLLVSEFHLACTSPLGGAEKSTDGRSETARRNGKRIPKKINRTASASAGLDKKLRLLLVEDMNLTDNFKIDATSKLNINYEEPKIPLASLLYALLGKTSRVPGLALHATARRPRKICYSPQCYRSGARTVAPRVPAVRAARWHANTRRRRHQPSHRTARTRIPAPDFAGCTSTATLCTLPRSERTRSALLSELTEGRGERS